MCVCDKIRKFNRSLSREGFSQFERMHHHMEKEQIKEWRLKLTLPELGLKYR